MNIMYPDYNNCIVNLACSIEKHFGIEPAHNTLDIVDNYLKKNYKNVIILLLDGLGTNVLLNNTKKDGFLQKHHICNYSSTFPSTTTASTTSIDTGLTPYEHGWLGWTCYLKEVGKNVVLYNNVDDAGITVADYNVAKKYLPTISIRDKIKDKGYSAYIISPFADNPFKKIETFSDICECIDKISELDEKKYIYAYWNEPDHTMHNKGCYSEEAREIVCDIEKQIENLMKDMDNTLLIITADHSQINAPGVDINDYPQIMECLERLPSIEPRALNLFIKEEYKDKFADRFNNIFSEKFILLSKKDVIDKKLFGTGHENIRFKSMLGDYLAIATSDLCIYNTKKDKDHFIGIHAGLTEEEMTIPLIIVNKKINNLQDNNMER